MKKVLTGLQEAAGLVEDGALVTFGGATFSRAPMEFVRELVRQGKKDLNLIDREPAMDFDLLIGAGCVAKVRAGMVGFVKNRGCRRRGLRKQSEKSRPRGKSGKFWPFSPVFCGRHGF